MCILNVKALSFIIPMLITAQNDLEKSQKLL